MRALRDIKRAKPELPVLMITGYGGIKNAQLRCRCSGRIQPDRTGKAGDPHRRYHWIKQHVGSLNAVQHKWPEQRLSAEIW
jgi:DNA-binding NtrC family response regulator